MTSFCASSFWDWDYTWYSEYPRLTPCFENTVLAYTPGIFLVLFGLLPWLVGRRKKPSLHGGPLSWTLLSLSRFVVSLLLTLTYGYSLVYKLAFDSSSGSSVTADLVHAVTFAIALKVQQNTRQNGQGSSMVLFFFWLMTVVCQLPKYSRHLQEVFASDSDLTDVSKIEFAVCATSYPMILVQLFLSCWTDARHDTRRPYLTAAPVSFIFMGWLSPFIFRRARNSVELEDIYSIPPAMTTRRNHSKWSELWSQELNSAGYVPGEGSYGASRVMPSIFYSLWKAYWKPVLTTCILATLRAVLRVIPALLLHLLTDYMAKSDPTWKGVLYAIGIVSANFCSGILAVHIDRILSFTGLNAKTVMVAAIYRKTLRLSSESQKVYTIGELINLISVDADRIFKLSITFGYVASGVPLIIITLILLWQYLGVACLAGVVVMLVIMPVVAIAVSFGNKYQTAQMKLKDKRLNTMAEMLSSVKVLKLFAWENLFMDKCSSVRLEEMGLLKKYSYLTALSFFILTCSSSMVALVSFVTYVLISGDHVLDATTAFVSLTLFNQMQFPMFIIPDFISNAVQTSVSMKRIRRFLLSSEIDDYSVGRRPDDGEAVSVKNATLSWSKERAPALRNINLSIKRGQLIAIVGPVGSGKSSLLSALLGNLRVCSGTIDCIESIAYAPQCAWIQNKTIRENVLFTSTYDFELYDMVLKACCLERDLEILSGGDMTEIGERGINLSGGQKQRVSLARAAYQKKDLYLFDDPLSAVDAHVGAALFKDLIGPRGMLKDTTRILVTHNLSVLSEVDYILVMQEGSIVESGSFEDLQREGSVLSGLLKSFSKRVRRLTENEETSTDSNEESEVEEEELGTTLVEREIVEEGSISLQVYGTYIKHAGPLLLLAVLFYAVYRAVGAYMGIWLSEWTNDSLLPSGVQDMSLRTFRIEIYILLCVCTAVANFFAVATLWKVALSASTTLHQLMLDSVMRAPLSFFDSTPSGRLLNRFGKDVEQLDVQLPTAAHFTLDFLLLFASSVVLICINLPVYILIVIPVVVFLLVLRQMYVVPFRQVKRLETVTRSPVNHHFSETMTGLSSVRGYSVQRIFLRDNDEKVDTMQNCTVNALNFDFWIEAWMEVSSEVLLLSMLLLLVANRDNIDPGIAALLVSYMLNAISPFNYLIFYSTELEATLVSAERLDEYRRLTPEAPWRSNCSPDPRWPESGAVSFKSYSTRYREGLDLVLRDVDLDVNPGEKIGIVGRTGAGKSTITLSLFRIVEAASGKIVVDDVDIATLGLHDLRSRITIIPQDPVLFRGTLRFNLDPAGQHEAEELWSALDRSHLGDVFRKSGGLDFEVAEGGHNLSVGQRQLVCLARAVLRKTKILVLDEATASVDMKTDVLVQQTLRDVMSECTVLTVAHRLHTVLTSDRVVVMDQGKVVEVGSPTELLYDSTSLFYAMAREAGVVFPGVNM
ncbi:multidrug resistance protein, putative [Ixodes scapularis]|uniref:ABC-type glutathione-S-conjugate transporter n=1 Tax=Ixodes scapularis TaxID=6945 RepID=B7Q372_IXOSC|nr:multidrug resistance protein, putative [Ixodes scapularis]|eukprot:XP_002411170.1 multidrug resistance protein, putative [Ixodes scapularis]